MTDLLCRVWAATAAARTATVTTRTSTELVVVGRPAEVLTVTGAGHAVLPTAAVDLQLRATPDVRVHWRFVAGALYAATPPAAGGDGSWTRTDLGDPAAYRSDAPPPNPVALLRDMSRSVTAAVPAGTVTLDGVEVTRYTATAELAAAAAAAPAGASRLALAHLEAVTGTGHLFVQVWIDGGGRIRRFTYTDQASSPAGSPSPGDGGVEDPATLATTTTTTTLSRFGTPAAVTALPTSSPGQ